MESVLNINAKMQWHKDGLVEGSLKLAQLERG